MQRLTKSRLQDHFRYNAWKYALIIALSVLVWDFIYLQTAYRPPEDKRIDWYVQSPGSSAEELDAYLAPIWQASVPEMEQVASVMLMPSGGNDYYADMQLSTYLMAGQGDVYLLPRDLFKRYAAQGVFSPLEGYVAAGRLRLDGLDAAAGEVTYVETEANGAPTVSERHLYGIPAAALSRLNEAGIAPDNLVIAVSAASGNEDNIITFLDAFIAASRE